MSIVILIIVLVVCLLLEGFFSGSELALVVADKLRLKNKADQGDWDARRAMRLIEKPSRLFSTTLLGTNVCVVTATTVLTYFIISNYGEEYSLFAILLSPIVLVFGEVVPKSVYQHHADYIAPRVGSMLMMISRAIYPVVWLVSRLTEILLGGVKRAAGAEPSISREELALILSSREVKDSDISPKERKMIKTVLDLSDAEVENIMTPLVEVEMLPVTADTESALAVFDLKGFSRLPVFEHRAYNIVGMIDSADCIFAAEKKPIREIMNPVIYVPESMPLYELYETLQDEKEEVAIVVDEYGGATGLVTLEDLLEEFVGEIKDEYELGEQHYIVIGKESFLVSGRMEIEDANEKLHLNIPDGDYETVAGYLLELFSYIPDENERVVANGWKYLVKKASNRAIIQVHVMRANRGTSNFESQN